MSYGADRVAPGGPGAAYSGSRSKACRPVPGRAGATVPAYRDETQPDPNDPSSVTAEALEGVRLATKRRSGAA